MTAIDVQGTSVSDVALALWAENTAISQAIQKTKAKKSESTTCR